MAVMAMSMIGMTSCEKTQSYSELLNTEEKAVNWYLAKHQVSPEKPAGDNFVSLEEDPNAPFYRMDEDGFVYMQVVRKGAGEKPKEGDRVYFPFMRLNLNYYHQTGTEVWEGNSEDLDTEVGPTSFLFGNTSLTSTTQYGKGIQLPMQYFGYGTEVNIVIKSPMGMTSDASSCIGYVYNIRYFKAEY